MKPHEVDSLPATIFYSMWRMISVIEAQDSLAQLQVVSYPNLKDESRKKVHRQLMEQAYPGKLNKKRKLSLQDLQGELMKRG